MDGLHIRVAYSAFTLELANVTIYKAVLAENVESLSAPSVENCTCAADSNVGGMFDCSFSGIIYFTRRCYICF